MTDEWERRDRPPPVVFEVPLLGDDGSPVGPVSGSPPPPQPNWRRIVGLAAIAGMAVGIVVAVVVLDVEGEDGDPPPTTLDPAELAATITTPEVLPLPGGGGADTDDLDDLDDIDGVTSQDRELFDLVPSITAPTYPSIDLPSAIVDRFELTPALDRLAEDVPRRSVTRYEVGEEAYRIVVTIDREAARDRFEILIDGDGDDPRLVVDAAAGVTYIANGSEPGAWTAVPNDELVADGLDLPDLVERLLVGPVRADTIADAGSVTPGNVVTIRDGAPPARRFAVTLRAGDVPEWARYRLGAVADAPPPDPDDPIGFFAYVSEAGDLVEVSGSFPFGNTEQLVVHRVVVLPPDFEIELPTTELADARSPVDSGPARDIPTP